MPYKLVLSKNGTKEEVTAVPEGWVVGGYLYWPNNQKKNQIELLRSNENSIGDKNWKKIKCRVKLSDIASFEEGLRLEELYSKFEDTEDEEKYLKERPNKKTQYFNAQSKQLLDLNSEFEVIEDVVTHSEISSEEVKVQPHTITTENEAYLEGVYVPASSSDKQDDTKVTMNDVQGTSTSNDENILTITTSELLKIIQENNSLQAENKILKEELLKSDEFQKETKKNFMIMQTQLDKVIELLQKPKNNSSSINDGNSEDGIDKIANFKFPIETKEQLDELEYKLLENDVMMILVKKFSAICGTSGIAKIVKIGLPLMKYLIKDELFNQFTWKGIKGSTKMSFVQYHKFRELFFKVAHLADKSCSFSDTDSFIQNSAIKHSGQRMKRHILSFENKLNVKKTKKEFSAVEKDTEDEGTKTIISTDDNCMDDDENMDVENVNRQKFNKVQGSSVEKESDDDDFIKTLDQPSPSRVTILSDVKLRDRVMGSKNINEMSNISSANVSSFFDDLIKF